MSPLVLFDLHFMRYHSLFLSPAQEESLQWSISGRAQDGSGQVEVDIGNSITGCKSAVSTGAIKRVRSVVAEPVSWGDKDKDDFWDARSSSSFDPFEFDDLLSPDHFIVVEDDKLIDETPPSRPGLNAALTGLNFLDCLAPSHLNRFPVIFDSGASIAITGNRTDFVGEVIKPFKDLRLGGMAQGAKVEGIGIVHWTFNTGQATLTLALRCYFVPDCKARLLSPQ